VDSLRGQLLIASPALLDPNFARAVVLIGEHSEEGALGVVLNRPSPLSLAEAAPELSTAGPEQPLFEGGPVQPTALVVLAEFDDPLQAGLHIAHGVGFPAPDSDLDELASWSRRARVYAGYAGWAPGQLDDEVERGDWILEPFGPEDVFCDDPDGLWRATLERKGARFALLARMPEDPSQN
jgi:putative transcriptional regulator